MAGMVPRVGIDVHGGDCRDDDGKLECVCGLEELLEDEAIAAHEQWITDGDDDGLR